MDLFNLPNYEKNIKTFYGFGLGVWQTWQKPKGVKFIQMYLIGGGGGGSSGYTNNTSTVRLGGGGGGGSSQSMGIFPSYVLPDTLYISVGMGGNGQTSSISGTSGGISYVSVMPNILPINVILASSNSGATCSNVQTGGVAGSVFTAVNGILSNLGIITTNGGGNGANGGTQASSPGGNTSLYMTSGGAGGGAITSGNTTANGGGVSAGSLNPTISGGITTGILNGISNPYNYFSDGNISMKNPMLFSGGLGGASSTTSNGGNGGNGSYGCGGGGGGASTIGNGIGGNGGNGGNGLVIITCW